MDIAALIERLKTKDRSAEVEFVVIEADGSLVTADVTAKQAKPLINFLKRFSA